MPNRKKEILNSKPFMQAILIVTKDEKANKIIKASPKFPDKGLGRNKMLPGI